MSVVLFVCCCVGFLCSPYATAGICGNKILGQTLLLGRTREMGGKCGERISENLSIRRLLEGTRAMRTADTENEATIIVI